MSFENVAIIKKLANLLSFFCIALMYIQNSRPFVNIKNSSKYGHAWVVHASEAIENKNQLINAKTLVSAICWIKNDLNTVMVKVSSKNLLLQNILRKQQMLMLTTV